MTRSLRTQIDARLLPQTSERCHRSGRNYGCERTCATAQSGSLPCTLCLCHTAQNPLVHGLRAKINRWVWDQNARSSFEHISPYYLPDRDPICDSVTVKEAPPYVGSFFNKYCIFDEADLDDLRSIFVPIPHQISGQKQTRICEEIRGDS